MGMKEKNVMTGNNLEQVSQSEGIASALEDTADDASLLEQSRLQWLLGDWGNLGLLKIDDVRCNAVRADLALLVASAKLQTGEVIEARRLLMLASKWGAGKSKISRILLGGVHRSLSRVAAVLDRELLAYQHIKNAVRTVGGGFEVTCGVDACYRSELLSLGMLPGCEGRLQILQSKQVETSGSSKNLVPLKAPSRAHAFYTALGKNSEQPVPFQLIDAKSLPRSGLHYLKTTMSRIFKEDFSFCEWYTEPGCCRQMPCALTGFAKLAQDTGRMKIRLTKSHDFELSDPVFQTSYNLRRLVLIRDPLFVLTSWFTLQQIYWHGDLLKKYGMQLQKINFSHEKSVLISAYALINDNFKKPTVQMVTKWLDEKRIYIKMFLDKWVLPINKDHDPFTDIIFYEEINNYIKKLCDEVYDFHSNEDRQDLSNWTGTFIKREDPFRGPTDVISALLYEYSPLFKDVVAEINTHPAFRNVGI